MNSMCEADFFSEHSSLSEESTPQRPRNECVEEIQFRSSKIIIEKLTKNVTIAHMKEIFEPFGDIQFVDLPENGQFDTNKGVAYILYHSTDSAEAAVAYMDEAQIDGSVIQVSLVYPKPKLVGKDDHLYSSEHELEYKEERGH